VDFSYWYGIHEEVIRRSQMQQSGGLLLAAGWTAATHLFAAGKCKRFPSSPPNRNATRLGGVFV